MQVHPVRRPRVDPGTRMQRYSASLATVGCGTGETDYVWIGDLSDLNHISNGCILVTQVIRREAVPQPKSR